MTINILDEKENRQAAARYQSLSLLPLPDGKQLLCSELLRHLANSASHRDREAAKWLRLMMEHDATLPEIAKLRGSTEAAVRNLLKTAEKKMRRITEQAAGTK